MNDNIKFKDRQEFECIISNIGDGFIELGINQTTAVISKNNAQKLGIKTDDSSKTWLSYPIPEDVIVHTTMMLDVEMVKTLITQLKRFVETGSVIEYTQWEVGKWVVVNNNSIVRIIKKCIDDDTQYLVSSTGSNSPLDHIQIHANSIMRYATYNEISNYLILTAKDKGFTKGVVITKPCAFIQDWWTIDNDSFGYYKGDILKLGKNTIYQQGVWANIKPLKLEQKPVIVKSIYSIECNGVTGTLDELQAIYKDPLNKSNKFGNVIVKDVYLENKHKIIINPHKTCYTNDVTRVNIGGIHASMKDLKDIITYCKIHFDL